jgi:hypothetical protein
MTVSVTITNSGKTAGKVKYLSAPEKSTNQKKKS